MSKLYPTDDELYTRTTVNLLAKEEHAQTVPLINNFGVKGFKISGDTVVGPVAILPRCLVHWNVSQSIGIFNTFIHIQARTGPGRGVLCILTYYFCTCVGDHGYGVCFILVRFMFGHVRVKLGHC